MSDIADGDVRKVDKEAKKITLRHGELKRTRHATDDHGVSGQGSDDAGQGETR